jgi:putative flippase GtrA
MAVMNVVWPVSALYFSVVAVWAYFHAGRAKSKAAMHSAGGHRENRSHEKESAEPTFWQVAIGTSHCGAGCMLADVASEFTIAACGITLLGSVLWAEYAIDLAAAWMLGIVFQYFAIKPMRELSAGGALLAAIKADTLSITAFQVGMYSWMALTFFVLFPHPHLTPWDPRYWLMMQIAMICGFMTSYPVNRWLIRKGIKEAM